MTSILRHLSSRLSTQKPAVVVSGLPRSGTSMMMQMLEAGGLEIVTDAERAADDDNPEGYYEFEKVKELNAGGDLAWLGECRGKAVKIISFLLMKLPADYRYRVIFLERDIDEVLASQKKMLQNRGKELDAVSDGKMKRNFEKHLREVRVFLDRAPNFDVLHVNFREVMERPGEHANKIAEFLGGGLDTGAMAGAVKTELYRNRR